MIAKIELYNNSGDLVGKYEAPPYNTRIDDCGDYETHQYEFRFMYSEYEPKRQERSE